jgi:hypothetical protein
MSETNNLSHLSDDERALAQERSRFSNQLRAALTTKKELTDKDLAWILKALSFLETDTRENVRATALRVLNQRASKICEGLADLAQGVLIAKETVLIDENNQVVKTGGVKARKVYEERPSTQAAKLLAEYAGFGGVPADPEPPSSPGKSKPFNLDSL